MRKSNLFAASVDSTISDTPSLSKKPRNSFRGVCHRILLLTKGKHLLAILAFKIDLALCGDVIKVDITEAGGETCYHADVTDDMYWSKVQSAASEAVKTGATDFSPYVEFERHRLVTIPPKG